MMRMREFTCRAVRSRFRTPLRGVRRRLHAQGGFALIEVVVSAALLMVVAGGVLAGIDGPGQVSARNEARSQASALAQRDQERMRAMPVAQLIGYSNTSNVTVNNPGEPVVTYSVVSSAVWLRDNTDTDSCNTSASDPSGDYLRITSRVTSPNSQAPPVQIDSLLTPPPGALSADTKGVLALQLKNQADAPIVGQSVSLTGPQSMTVPTNAAGCAVFGLVNKGNYTMTFSRTGWVDPAGVSAVSIPTSVTPGSTTIETHSYAQAGTINVSVDTNVGTTVSNAPAKAVTVANQDIPNGSISFPATTSTQYQFNLQVFPFLTSYNVWAGGCASGNPLTYSKPGVTALVTPGGSVPVTVRQPSITVTGATGVTGYPGGNYPINTSGVKVVYQSVDPGCTEKYSQTTNSTGKVPNPGVPYGNYKVCAEVSSNYGQVDSFLNQVAAGTSMTVPYRGSGACP
jgi:type II secretory pathway pseudopilin PulG